MVLLLIWLGTCSSVVLNNYGCRNILQTRFGLLSSGFATINGKLFMGRMPVSSLMYKSFFFSLQGSLSSFEFPKHSSMEIPPKFLLAAQGQYHLKLSSDICVNPVQSLLRHIVDIIRYCTGGVNMLLCMPVAIVDSQDEPTKMCLFA